LNWANCLELDYLQIAMVVAMSVMGIVEMAVDQIVDVVSVGDLLVSAAGAVNVYGVVAFAGVTGCTVGRVDGGNFDDAFIVMAVVGGVKMAVVEVIRVSVVMDGDVAAIRAVNVDVVFVGLVRMDVVLHEFGSPQWVSGLLFLWNERAR